MLAATGHTGQLENNTEETKKWQQVRDMTLVGLYFPAA